MPRSSSASALGRRRHEDQGRQAGRLDRRRRDRPAPGAAGVSAMAARPNEALLNDPLYLGNRRTIAALAPTATDSLRTRRGAASRLFPNGPAALRRLRPGDAHRILAAYADSDRIVNDGVQGTGGDRARCVAVCHPGHRAWRSAASGLSYSSAGTASAGIADQRRRGQGPRRRHAGRGGETGSSWWIEQGMLTSDMPVLHDIQQRYASDPGEVKGAGRGAAARPCPG